MRTTARGLRAAASLLIGSMDAADWEAAERNEILAAAAYLNREAARRDRAAAARRRPVVRGVSW